MMECCLREKKLGDFVWTGRIESVTCLRSLQVRASSRCSRFWLNTKPNPQSVEEPKIMSWTKTENISCVLSKLN